MEKNLGHATAYGYAKSKGYSGTEEEFAELMADYASVGQSAAQSAEQAAASATSASGSATTASQAAQTATSKASEAVTAADTATTKASEASQSASTASAAATSAGTSAQTATTAADTATAKASEASESAATATTAKTDAESARDAAAQSASEAAESARTLTIDATLTQSGQAADAKATGDAITELKNELNSVENVAVELIYDTDITAESTEQGYQIYYKPSTGQYIKASTSGTTYWKLTTFPATPYTRYKAFGAYQKDTPIAVFVDSNGNYIGSTDTYPDGTYSGTREYVEFTTPAGTSKIITNIFMYSYISTLARGTYKNVLSDDVEQLNNDLFEFVNTGEYDAKIIWEQGNLNGTTGQPISANNAVRSNDYLSDPGTYLIKTNGQLVYGYKYLIDGTRNGNYFWGASSDIIITIDAEHKARFVVMNGNSTFTPEECTVTVWKQTIIRDVISQIPKNHGDFISICHQGYSEADSLGHNLLEGYPLAKQKGFDWGECDLKLTSDGVLVCCHDPMFVDQTTQETITIRQHTLAELQTYNYYGSTIATFEDVVKTCKLNGLGLVIDQSSFDNKDLIFPIVKKYGMQRRVAYLLIYNAEYPQLIRTIYNSIHAFDEDAHFMVAPSGRNVESDAVSFCNEINTKTNKVELSLNYANHTVEQILSLQSLLNADVNVVVWTIDNVALCKNYLPYVTAITSNKVSSTQIFN